MSEELDADQQVAQVFVTLKSGVTVEFWVRELTVKRNATKNFSGLDWEGMVPGKPYPVRLDIDQIAMMTYILHPDPALGPSEAG